MGQNVIHGFYSDIQKKEGKEYYTCKNKVGDNIICTTFKSNENIEDLKILYPDIKYKGYVTDPINKTEIRGRFLLKFQVIKPEIL
jgi:hypothetical protein